MENSEEWSQFYSKTSPAATSSKRQKTKKKQIIYYNKGKGLSAQRPGWVAWINWDMWWPDMVRFWSIDIIASGTSLQIHRP